MPECNFLVAPPLVSDGKLCFLLVHCSILAHLGFTEETGHHYKARVCVCVVYSDSWRLCYISLCGLEARYLSAVWWDTAEILLRTPSTYAHMSDVRYDPCLTGAISPEDWITKWSDLPRASYICSITQVCIWTESAFLRLWQLTSALLVYWMTNWNE